MPDTNILLLIGLICALFGFALGGLVASARASKGQAGPGDPNHELVFRLWRDRRRGDLLPEIDGKVAHSAKDLTPEQARQVAQTIQALRFWLGQAPAETPPIAPPAESPAASRPPAPLEPPAKASSGRLSMNPVDILARGLSAEIPKPAPGPKSIVAQIDEILQEKLAGTPLEPRGVHLSETPHQGMVVMVGKNQYEGVEQVPDEVIKAAIRAAVAEWEHRVGGA